jgi:hypothetical protein
MMRLLINTKSYFPGLIATALIIGAVIAYQSYSNYSVRVTKNLTEAATTNALFQHMQYYGYYNVTYLGAFDYLDEVAGKGNLITIFYHPSILQRSFVDRLQQYGIRINLMISAHDEAFVFNTNGIRDAQLQEIRDRLTESGLINYIAFISPGEEWYSLMSQDFFKWSVLQQCNSDSDCKRDVMKKVVEDIIVDVNKYFPGIPTLLVEPNWNNSSRIPPVNVDVLGIDAYFVEQNYGTSVDRCDLDQRSRFDADVTTVYNTAKTLGKPIMMIPGAFESLYLHMPATCVLQWYYDLANSMPQVIGMNWYNYPDYYSWDIGMRSPRFDVERQFIFGLYHTTIGDFDHNGIVNSFDWAYMNSKWYTNDSTADLNKDGIVNTIDFSMMNQNWLK